jgi:hypothetical protein
VRLYDGLVCVLPREFRQRYRDEMRLDFTDQLNACATRSELLRAVGNAHVDLLVSVVREWRASETLRLPLYAVLAHTGIWLTCVVMAAWQWPGGSRVFPVVLAFALMSAPGILLTIWRQRLHTMRSAGCCPSRAAELD